MNNVTTRSIIAKYRSASTVKQIIRSTLNSDIIKGYSCDKSDFADAEGIVYNIYGSSSADVKLESWDWFESIGKSKKTYSAMRADNKIINKLLTSEGDRLIDFPVPVDARKMASKVLGYRFLLSGTSCQTQLGILSTDLAFHSIAEGHPDNVVFHSVDVIPVWGAGFNRAYGVRTKQMCDFNMSYFGYGMMHSDEARMCLVHTEVVRHGAAEIKKAYGNMSMLKGNATFTHVITHVYVDLASCVALMWNKLYHSFETTSERVSALQSILNHNASDVGTICSGLTKAMRYYITRELAVAGGSAITHDAQCAYDRDINYDVSDLYAHLTVFVGDIIRILTTLSLPVLSSVLSEASMEDLSEAFKDREISGSYYPLHKVVRQVAPYLPAGTQVVDKDGVAVPTRFNPITGDAGDATHARVTADDDVKNTRSMA